MKTVLFVCLHNSGRSQMAEGFFNKVAKGSVLAISAGTKPSEKLNPEAVKAMGEIGIDIGSNKPKMLTPEMVQQAERVITMGCGVETGAACPARFIITDDWRLEDPAGKTLEAVRKIRDEIEKKVLELIKEIQV